MRENLKTSIFSAVVGYFLLQCCIFLGFSVPVGFFGDFALLFFSVSLGFHLFLLSMLLFLKHDFVLEATGTVLTRVNRANMITLFRVSTLPTLLVLIIAARDHRIRVPLLCLVVLVFISDFLDGYVSRKRGEVTRVGRMLDSASDYSLLAVLTVVFFYFALIPTWLFALIIGRLFLQAMLMAIIFAKKRHIEPKTTIMGKVAIASIMVFYALGVASIAFGLNRGWPFTVCEWTVGAIIAASVVDKLVAFAREISPDKTQRASGNGPGAPRS